MNWRSFIFGALASACVAIGAWFIWLKPNEPIPLVVVDKTPPWGNLNAIDRIIILGIPTTGKTTFAAEITKDARRVLYFDPMGDYPEKTGAVAMTVDDFLTIGPEVLSKPTFKIAVRPEAGDDREMAEDLAAVISIARAIGNMVVVLDEVGDYRLPAEGTINKLFRNGRHYGIVTVLVSQVATDIPKTCRRIPTRIYSFLQEDPADLEYLEDKCGPEFVRLVRDWQPGKPPAEWRLTQFNWAGVKRNRKTVKPANYAPPVSDSGGSDNRSNLVVVDKEDDDAAKEANKEG